MLFKHFSLEYVSPLLSAVSPFSLNCIPVTLINNFSNNNLKVDCTCLKSSILKVHLCVCAPIHLHTHGGMGKICETLFFLRGTGCHGISPSLAWKWGRGGRPWWDTERSHYGRKLPHWSGTGQAVMEGGKDGYGVLGRRGTVRLALQVQVSCKKPPLLFCVPAGPPLL